MMMSFSNGDLILINPIAYFKYEIPVFVNKAVRQIVVRIDQENIGSGFKTPLKPAIYIEVFYLCIILQKSCPE